MTVDDTFETTMIRDYYPLIRDSFAYAAGVRERFPAVMEIAGWFWYRLFRTAFHVGLE